MTSKGRIIHFFVIIVFAISSSGIAAPPVPDTTPPSAVVTLEDGGPPCRIEVTIQDTGSGLAEILVTLSSNADTVVPPFTVGTNDPVVMSSTKIDQTQGMRIEARITDVAGNVTFFQYPTFDYLAVAGSTGAVDEGDLSEFEVRNQFATIKDSVSSAVVTYRYNLPAVDDFDNCEDCTYAIRIRYRDTGTNQRVVVRLRAANVAQDGVTTLFTFDSDTGSASTLNQTFSDHSVSLPGDHVDHGNYVYFLEVEVTKTANDGTPSPGLIAFSISDGQASSECGSDAP
jgi:hypothetical protein